MKKIFKSALVLLSCTLCFNYTYAQGVPPAKQNDREFSTDQADDNENTRRNGKEPDSEGSGKELKEENKDKAKEETREAKEETAGTKEETTGTNKTSEEESKRDSRRNNGEKYRGDNKEDNGNDDNNENNENDEKSDIDTIKEKNERHKNSDNSENNESSESEELGIELKSKIEKSLNIYILRELAKENEAGYSVIDAIDTNPNWINLESRLAFARLMEFAVEERALNLSSRRNSSASGRHIGDSFDYFMDPDNYADAFLISAVEYCVDKLGMDKDELLYELTSSILGDSSSLAGFNCPDNSKLIFNRYLDLSLYNADEEAIGEELEENTEIIPLGDASEAFSFILNNFTYNDQLTPGDKVAIATPSSISRPQIPGFIENDYKTIYIKAELDEENNCWEISDDEISKLKKNDVKTFILANPSAKDPFPLSEKTIRKLEQAVDKNPELIILADESYGVINDEFQSLYASMPQNTILVYSFSKLYGKTGYQDGIIALSKENKDRLFNELQILIFESISDLNLNSDINLGSFTGNNVLSGPSLVMMDLLSLSHLISRNEDPYVGYVKETLNERYQAISEGIRFNEDAAKDNSEENKGNRKYDGSSEEKKDNRRYNSEENKDDKKDDSDNTRDGGKDDLDNKRDNGKDTTDNTNDGGKDNSDNKKDDSRDDSDKGVRNGGKNSNDNNGNNEVNDDNAELNKSRGRNRAYNGYNNRYGNEYRYNDYYDYYDFDDYYDNDYNDYHNYHNYHYHDFDRYGDYNDFDLDDYYDYYNFGFDRYDDYNGFGSDRYDDYDDFDFDDFYNNYYHHNYGYEDYDDYDDYYDFIYGLDNVDDYYKDDYYKDDYYNYHYDNYYSYDDYKYESENEYSYVPFVADIDIHALVLEEYGEGFTEWMNSNFTEYDFLSELAFEKGVVLMGNEIDPSIQKGHLGIALAGNNAEDYEEIIRRIYELLDEYEKEYLALNKEADSEHKNTDKEDQEKIEQEENDLKEEVQKDSDKKEEQQETNKTNKEEEHTDLKIAYLGGKGSYSEEAAKSFFKDYKSLISEETIDDAIADTINGKYDYAVIPVENISSGENTYFMDVLLAEDDIYITGEVILPTGKNDKTKFYIISNEESDEIEGSQAVISLICNAGKLNEVIDALNKEKLELVSIHNRPEGSSLQSYHYIIEIQGKGKNGISEEIVKSIEDSMGDDIKDARFMGSFELIEK